MMMKGTLEPEGGDARPICQGLHSANVCVQRVHNVSLVWVSLKVLLKGGKGSEGILV